MGYKEVKRSTFQFYKTHIRNSIKAYKFQQVDRFLNSLHTLAIVRQLSIYLTYHKFSPNVLPRS
jgi:hypothetical protein